MARSNLNAQSAAQKWSTTVASRQAAYQTGVQGAAAAYDAGVSGAEARWAQGVQDAISHNRFSNGVAGKGQVYATQASTIGPARWTTGVNAAQGKYAAAVGAFFTVIQGVNLPPRQSRGNPANMARVSAIADALHAAKRR